MGDGGAAVNLEQQVKQRFLAKVHKTDTCWLWMAARAGTWKMQYGTFFMRGKNRRAHRASYELFVGPIPVGMTIDHECQIPLCVNPAHLKPVTLAENNRLRWIRQGVKLFCKRGHIREVRPGKRMFCRECSRISCKEYQQRKAAA